MFSVLKKYVFATVLVIVSIAGIFAYIKKVEYDKRIVELSNKLASQVETTELHKNAYTKQSLELKNLEDILKAFEKESESDKDTIKKLRKELDRKDETLVTANRLVVKWKEAYESIADAEQSDQEDRKRVDFEKDFGYISINGFTLTDPAYAWVKVQQMRPLTLSVFVSQTKDGRWNSYVTTSEDNLNVDIRVAAINPYVFEPKWYENISLDFTMDIYDRIVPAAGVSYPVGPLYLSAGVWADVDAVGPYFSVGYSFRPFLRKR